MPADLIAHGVAAAATTATNMIPARGGAPRAGLGGDRADMGLARPPRQRPVNRWVGSRPDDAADRRPTTSRTGWSGVRRAAGRPLPRREQGRGGVGPSRAWAQRTMSMVTSRMERWNRSSSPVTAATSTSVHTISAASGPARWARASFWEGDEASASSGSDLGFRCECREAGRAGEQATEVGGTSGRRPPGAVRGVAVRGLPALDDHDAGRVVRAAQNLHAQAARERAGGLERLVQYPGRPRGPPGWSVRSSSAMRVMESPG